ncbi:hypothetical protein ABPG74_010665 [Tetrahymena malaccensis]
MIKYLLTVFLVLSNIYCDCSSHSTNSQCTSDKNCSWKPDTTMDQCINLETNCGGKSKPDCKGTCTYTDEVKGKCSPQATYCTNLPDHFCTSSAICNFTPGAEICQNKKDGYKCDSLKTEAACTAADKTYCLALGTCVTPSSTTCDTTNDTTCKASSACDYQELKKAGCFTSSLYCSVPACVAKDPFCIKTIQSSNCAQKRLEKNCFATYDDEPTCGADQNCYWDKDYQSCQQKKCDQIKTQLDCDKQSYCEWDEDFICTPDDSKCPVSTPKTDCEAITETPGNSGLFKPCYYQELSYTCNPKDLTKCVNYKDKKSCIDGGCSFTFSTCIDGDAQCGSKPVSDCTTKYSATCEKGNQKGTCADKPGICNSYPDSATCGSNNCSWSNGTSASCANTVNCSKLSQPSCSADTTNCSWVTGGTCISKTFDDVQNNALSQKLLQITLLVIIAVLMI